MACTSALWRLLAGCGRRYLRLLPAAERAALRHSWVLEQLERLTLTLTLTLTLILTLTLTLTLTRSGHGVSLERESRAAPAERYVGEWSNDVRHGRGALELVNGEL